MTRWLWLFLSMLAIAGLLASTPGIRHASDMRAIQAQHDCCPGMNGAPDGQTQHGPHNDHATTPACCVLGVCAFNVAPPSPLRIGALRPPVFSLVDFFPLRHDGGHAGQSRPPDLRPPIA